MPRCYYDVLGIPQNADETAIKKAYRLQALQWHPDKNQHRLEEADERFKEICNAYEVLSDQHERAWYDNHRDAILRADTHQAGSWGFSGGSARPTDEEDLFSYFSARCYSGYGDDAKGFYAVYDTLFEKLVQQEVRAAERRDDADARESLNTAPRFGQSDAAWAKVAAFYDHFLSFATLKDFAWSDEHNPAAAPNRKVRRLIEEENSKRRKALRRHYNETVRELAAFVRKRDKRVLAHNAEEAAKRQAREAEIEKQRAADKAARAAAAAEYREADWITASEQPASSGEESEEEELVDWQCVICNKTFRSEKALANHERSKKHLEKLAEVREMLQAQEEELGGDAAAESSSPAAQPPHATADGEQQPSASSPAEADADADADAGANGRQSWAGSEESDGVPAARLSRKQQMKKQKKRERQRAAMLSAADGATHAESDDEAAGSGGADQPSAAQRSEAAAAPVEAAADSAGSDGSDVGGDTDMDEEEMLASMLRSAHVQQRQPAAAESSSEDEDSAAPDGGGGAAGAAADSGAGAAAADASAAAQDSDSDAQNGAAAAEPEAEAPAGKQAKGKRRRAKGSKKGCKVAAAAAAAAPEPVGNSCAVCGQEFPSRTKLFAHISSSGHARLKV